LRPLAEIGGNASFHPVVHAFSERELFISIVPWNGSHGTRVLVRQLGRFVQLSEGIKRPVFLYLFEELAEFPIGFFVERSIPPKIDRGYNIVTRVDRVDHEVRVFEVARFSSHCLHLLCVFLQLNLTIEVLNIEARYMTLLEIRIQITKLKFFAVGSFKLRVLQLLE